MKEDNNIDSSQNEEEVGTLHGASESDAAEDEPEILEPDRSNQEVLDELTGQQRLFEDEE